ncbi:MAG: transcriptional regulator [Oxalobacteraceae bacterium]|nr:transcriptional regulator [Oxalobacteraceae bacterium]
MRVIAVSTLRAFWERYPDAEQPLKAWYEEATSASWSKPADIKVQYRSEADYKATLKEISALMESDPDLGTPEGDRLDILATLVQAYEAKYVPITAPDPVEAIKFCMDQRGLSVKDLEPIIGKSNRVYEVLSRKRPLTLAMIRRLHKSLGIPADVLIAETAAG